MNEIYIKVGEAVLTAVLEDNESAVALKELLADGPLTIQASNYGGFEKVCSLGTELPRNDTQITTHAGDICLYNGSQIVIFHGSNSWAYTRLGKVAGVDEAELRAVLSGEETEITLSLEPM
ncbi:MAG: cyclophilin-like fold protein [Roseburia sp.]|nr:cyclophilin-like fold protein [Roseburia sp.]